jgi:Tol biopolymer transport system component
MFMKPIKKVQLTALAVLLGGVGGYQLICGSQIDSSDPVRASSGWGSPVKVEPPINTSAWEDSPCISPDGTLLFFSRGRYDAGQRDKNVGVYCSRKVDGKWTKPVYTEFNANPYPTAAVKAKDNQTVYFASIRPGGYGKGDIYFATRQPGGGWTTGQNLGPPINTKYNESEPYCSPDGTKLYFTSERPGGLGGMDNYVSTNINGKWTNPVNLGKPANSKYDDLQPFLTSDGTSLYFARMNFASIGKLVEGYHASIRRCDLVNSKWGDPQVVVSDFVGEPSLTADGRYLYFAHVIFARGKPVDSDIMVVEKQ